jgi:hypothetical protein
MKIGKKFIHVLLVLVMIIGTLPVNLYASEKETGNNTPAFLDMPDNWSKAALQNAVANGLLNGTDGYILPNDNLTRAQMAAVITRAFGAKVKGNLKDFSDIKSDEWYAESMAKAYQMGVIKGSDGKLNPNDAITRQEVFAVIARAFKLQPAVSINKVFTDVNEISDWAKGEVYAVVNGGYVKGSNGKLNPKGLITRAEFAQIFDNILKQYIRTEGVVTSVSNGNIMINTPNVTLKDLTVNGDLIIGDGVGDGEVVLDNVNVVGRMVVRGGGKDSIIIRGSSDVSNIIISRVDGAVSIRVQGDSNVEIIYIDDGSDDVNIEGTVGNIDIIASGIIVNAVGTTINSINILGGDSTIIIDANSTVETINVAKDAANAKAEVEGTVNTITTAAAGSEITGTGTVERVEAKEGATGAKILTPNTQIVVDANVTGVTGIEGVEISGGSTVNNDDTDTKPEETNTGKWRRRTNNKKGKCY